MKTTVLFLAFLSICLSGHAQKLVSKNSHVWFVASTPLETIEAHNRQAVSILDPQTGQIAFNLLIKSFEFKIALMQEHFNENYLESDKYPKSSFSGKIVNNKEIDYAKKGTYKAEINGDLTIHNVTRQIQVNATIEVNDQGVNAKSFFIIKPADYQISIPQVVENKIAKEVQISIDANYSVN